MNATHLTLIPKVSEKSYDNAIKARTYVFMVDKHANKQQIADAVASQFNVKVENVRTLVTKGKPVRTMVLNRQRIRIDASRSDRKKAYVTLVEGDSIKIFDEETK
jgi:large subunit ribosomal protein L23